MILVDTNVWSELLRPEPDRGVVEWEAAHADRLWFSTIVLAEWRARASLLPEGRRRTEIADAIEQVVARYADRIVTFDEKCSRYYGEVLASARNAGKPIQAPDAMIAATARANGMSVATRDTNDFAGAGVDVIDPWQN